MPESNITAEQAIAAQTASAAEANAKYVKDAAFRQEEIATTMWSSIKSQIKDRKGGWGKDESMAVIGDIITADAAFIAANLELSPEAKQAVGLMINPSATRQWLESKDVALLDKLEASTTSKRASWLKTVK